MLGSNFLQDFCALFCTPEINFPLCLLRFRAAEFWIFAILGFRVSSVAISVAHTCTHKNPNIEPTSLHIQRTKTSKSRCFLCFGSPHRPPTPPTHYQPTHTTNLLPTNPNRIRFGAIFSPKHEFGAPNKISARRTRFRCAEDDFGAEKSGA